MKQVIIIRFGHRFERDQRMTTHIGLISRALGANGMIITDVTDERIKNSIDKVKSTWGGNFFVEMGINWREIIKEIKKNRHLLIHLTMYGLRLEKSIIKRIENFKNDIYIFIGSQKVPPEIYSLADLNISISNQPQSECGALAIFLDRIFKTLYHDFKGARLRIIPSPNDKKIKKIL